MPAPCSAGGAPHHGRTGDSVAHTLTSAFSFCGSGPSSSRPRSPSVTAGAAPGPNPGAPRRQEQFVLTVRAPKTPESVSAVAPRRDRTVVSSSTAVYSPRGTRSLGVLSVWGERLSAPRANDKSEKGETRDLALVTARPRLSMRLSHSRSLCSVVLAWLACLLPSHRRPMIHEPRSLRRPLDARQRELDPRPRVQLLEGDHERGAVEAPRARVGLHAVEELGHLRATHSGPRTSVEVHWARSPRWERCAAGARASLLCWGAPRRRRRRRRPP